MSQGLSRTTLIECPRSQSDEGIANNNQNPSQWSNRVGDGLHLKPGDKISVHSSYISEIGAEAGQIQIKGQDLNGSVEVEITEFTNTLRDEAVPQKFGLQKAKNIKKTIDIRDDTLNLVVSPYKCANGEYYSHLPRRFITTGTANHWNTYHSRDVNPVDGDLGQTALPPPPLNRCSSDINIKYWPYRTGTPHTRYRIDGINDGSRFTLFSRKETFYHVPSTKTITLEGQAKAGSPIITFTHGSTTADLLEQMELRANFPETVFPPQPGPYATILSVDSDTQITMSQNATANTNSHNIFDFRFPSGVEDTFLPPTTLNSSFTADECEGFRDPALWGDYIQVKDLISVKANPGYNSPSDLADQLTQELNDRTDIETFAYPTTSLAGTFTRNEKFTFKTETPCNKVYNCATATNFMNENFQEWEKTNGTWDIPRAYNLLANYKHIGLKRPELYITGLEVNGSLSTGTSYTEGGTGERNGLLTSQFLPMAKGEKVFVTGLEWNKTNLLRFRDFFNAQKTYPELFDYTQSGNDCNVDETRFLHVNLFDNSNGTIFTPFGGRAFNFGSNVRNDKCPDLGYDLYNSAVSSSQTSFPMFIDYNPATENVTENDVGYTDRGFNYYYSGLETDYDDLAYGFARKIRRVQGIESYVIGFQFTRTGNKIPDHFFHTNASAEVGEPTEVLGAGGRRFGFDWHFTAYGTSAIVLYNGNVNERGDTFHTGSIINETKQYRFSQATEGQVYYLDPYQWGMYLGADTPQIVYDQDQQRFQLRNLHTAEVVGNAKDAGLNDTVTIPADPNAGDPCYKINKRMLLWNYSPDFAPYTDNFSASYATGELNSFISHNVGIEPWSIMDSQSGLFIEDWIVPENLWDESLVGIMGYRYDQFHNPNTQSSRQVRLKAHGANADLNNVNILTTNANIGEADVKGFQQNTVAATQYTPVLPVAVQPGGTDFTLAGQGRYITPAITNSPVQSVNITAERLPTKTLRPYYTIRSDIISEPNQVLGGLTSGVTMPIVAITNKANPYGDFLNGFQGQIEFTNTIDRVITRIKCSIHEPNGEFARCDLNSAVIFRIDQQVNANLDVVGDLLRSKKKSDQLIAQEVEEPELEFQNVKYKAKDLFE